MDNCSRILQENEIDSYDVNNKVYDMILKEFVSKIGDIFLFFDSQPACETSEDLKDNCIYASEYVELFFAILKNYHTYTLDKSCGNVIDLCYNAIVNKDSYYNIFDPEGISIILNRNVERELKWAISQYQSAS